MNTKDQYHRMVMSSAQNLVKEELKQDFKDLDKDDQRVYMAEGEKELHKSVWGSFAKELLHLINEDLEDKDTFVYLKPMPKTPKK